ncbi:DeoR family transcriptional regulator [Bibersteinia trehalosi]|uniref:glucitol operon DNA-binding transcriptional repressor SrlR n=1 Tax=Bibersteinia trehalosi TaxID=47735 RepID=UPI00104D68B8|nr:DNA-binding transcriptional repressor [Bibersteinia trehalosi]TCT13886.1 DeoR family transcriptional regulator [Bibersteinia trehalosi]
MKPIERQKQILDYLSQHGRTDVEVLAEYFKLTGATIRKDLTVLEQQNKVLRTYGSVVILQDEVFDASIDQKNHINLLQKQKIGQKASELINDGDSIIMDAGSTVLQMIPHLVKFDNLTVMTNSLHIINGITQLKKNYNLMISGGTYRERSASFHGYFAESAFNDSTFDTLFIGTDGFDLEVGLTTFNEIYGVSSAMCRAAKKIVVLADSTKFGRKSPNIVCGLEKIDVVISDSQLSEEMKERIEQKGIQVIIV